MSGAGTLDLATASERSGRDVVTLRKFINEGRLSAVRVGRKYYVKQDDLDSACLTHGDGGDEGSREDLKSWAKRMAAQAPPLREEQRAIIRSAFATVLQK
ncbi:hypothetical protein ANMWB30_24980 [Arthrobacter sp. MWB30]|nr:hypothetical protein ANMWB30_24980 [Arthrobacter sp. MWB30]